MLRGEDSHSRPSRGPSSGWSARAEAIGVAVWTSFIAACIESMVIFAFLDPITLSADGGVPMRPLLYGCGFFFLWVFAFLACGLTAYMLESGPHASAGRADEP